MQGRSKNGNKKQVKERNLDDGRKESRLEKAREERERKNNNR